MATPHPYIIGLTGGIGSGKSLVSDSFAQLGIDIIDADVIARDVVAPGSDGLRAIAAHFGQQVLSATGELDRSALRARVFTNETEKQWLNQCLHPRIRQQMSAEIAAVSSAYGLLVVPLLIENNLQAMAQRILVVDCPETMQLQRALQRDGSDVATIKGIMAAQVSRQVRLAAADDVITNTGTVEDVKQQVHRLHHYYLTLGQCHT